MRHRLRPAFPALLDDLSFYPDHALDSRWKQFLFRGGIAVALVVIVYLPVATSELLWVNSIGPHRAVWLLSQSGLSSIWALPPARASYFPLADTLLWVEYQAFESRSPPYHLVSVVLHAANVLLVWKVLRRLALPGAWLIAVLFGLHPAQTQAVAWIGGQPTLLGATFCLASILCYLKFSGIRPSEDDDDSTSVVSDMADSYTSGLFFRDGGPFSYAWALSLFAGALLSAPWALSLPLVVMLLVWLRRRRISGRDFLSLSPFVAMAIAAGSLQTRQAENVVIGAGIAEYSIVERILISSQSIAFYLTQVLFPAGLSSMRPVWNAEQATFARYLLLAGICIGLILLWRKRSSYPGLWTAAMCYVVLVIPVSGVVRHQWMSSGDVGDHLGYLARLGPIALLSAVVKRFADVTLSVDARRFRRFMVGVVAVGAAGATTCLRSLHYANTETFWRNVLAGNPTSSVAIRGLASAMLEDGRPDQAEQSLRAALVVLPNDPDLAVDLAWLLSSSGRTDEAEQHLRWALHLRPDDNRAARRFAELRLHLGNDAEALHHIQAVLKRNPNDAAARGQLGTLYRRGGHYADAMREYRAALDLQPSLTTIRLEFADLLFHLGRLPESAAELQEVVRIDPRNFEAYMKAGDMLGILKDFARAERMFRSAVRIRPTSAEAYNNLGVALAAQGRMSEAVYSFGQAINLKPDFGSAHRNLKWANAQKEEGPRDLPSAQSQP